uniref:Uncharacterized protein n=1 Tax=Heterorhabditis bacteriophora TaxID=37862 RepID=A0A1I7X536_HETBA
MKTFSGAQDNWQQNALSALSALSIFRAKLTFDEEEGISDSRGYYENISGPQKA